MRAASNGWRLLPCFCAPLQAPSRAAIDQSHAGCIEWFGVKLASPFPAFVLPSRHPACLPSGQARQLGLIDFDKGSGMWRALHGGFDMETDLLAEEEQDELLSFYEWVESRDPGSPCEAPSPR